MALLVPRDLQDHHPNGVIPASSGGNPRLSPIPLSPTAITRSRHIQAPIILPTRPRLILLTLNILPRLRLPMATVLPLGLIHTITI